MNKHGRIIMMLLSVALLATVALASGCNTMEGVGEDISAVGNSLSDAAGSDD